jgi:hypothetical protein
MSTNVIVKLKKQIVPQELLEKALNKYTAAFGFATTDAGDILQGKENFDPTKPASAQLSILMETQEEYKDKTMVFWFSSEPVNGNSLQPFSIYHVLQDEPGEDGTMKEEEADKIVAFLSGDFKEKLKPNDPHTGEFWACVEDARPKLMEFIEASTTDDQVSLGTFKKLWDEKTLELANKVFVNEDNNLILLLSNGECLIFGENEAGEGHSEETHWIHTVLEDPKPVVVEPDDGLIRLKKKVKSTTASVPLVPKAEEKPEVQKLITPTGTIETVKFKPGSNFNGSHEMTKNWYRLVNSQKDSRGLGVVPDQFIKTKTYVAVNVDKRIAECGATTMKDLTLFVHGLRAKEREGTSENKPEVTKVDRSISTRIVSADQKEKLKQDWLPMAKSGRSPTEIQADEKEAPTFKDITGVTMEDIKKMSFSAFVDLTKYPTACATLIHDLLHRPYGTIHGTVGTDTSKPAAPVSNPNKVKPKMKVA